MLPFLLTRPLRDVTDGQGKKRSATEFLLTRPLRDVTLTLMMLLMGLAISTHTPLAGRDFLEGENMFDYYGFLLTRPLRDVTLSRAPGGTALEISTHTPLAGRDLWMP